MGSLQGEFVERRWISSDVETGLRLDAFLHARLPFLSRRELQRAIGEACFTVNGRPARKGARLVEGDVVAYAGPAAQLADAPAGNSKLYVPVIHEDAALVALNKPASMDCHGFSGRDQSTLVNFVLARWPELAGVGRNRWDPALVHRIDRETSGLVLVAKSDNAYIHLRRQFRRGAVQKIYLALVHGTAPARATIAWPLTHDTGDKRKMRAVTAARAHSTRLWPALTAYEKLCERQGLSLLRLEMRTGVTHQLRAHLAAAGHPIVGDLLYGAPPENPGLARHFLHAGELRFVHPVSQNAMVLKAGLAPELKLLLQRLSFGNEWRSFAGD
jgi:23S rRNA pseudouridine1911/1915/1917 synthase